MRNHLIKVLFVALFIHSTGFAGGLFTNTNQSASFLRQPAQDAVLDATGTYYNPAGLAFLSNGFHFSLNNQYITQTRTINSTFPGLAKTEFEGGVSAPLFPSVYGVYKSGPVALSLGVNPIGGGGSATFENGLPSFDQSFAGFVNQVAAAGINTSYGLDANFDASSLNWGIQVNGSYALNQNLSFSAGIRYVTANNTYKGHLRNVMINPIHPLNPAGSGNMIAAPVFFNALSTASFGTAQSLQTNFIDAGVGGLTLSELQILNRITPEMKAAIEAGLPGYNASMTVSQIANGYTQLSQQMAGISALTSVEFRDREVNATQSGSGIAPIFGMNIKFSDDLNLAVKYEHKTSITLTNSTVVDDVGLYPNNVETKADMPAMLATGLTYWATPSLRLSGGFHYYFDKSADYGRKINGVAVPNEDIIDRNFIEYAFGAEYALSRRLIASAGYLRTQTGVNDAFQSDLSHSLNTNSVGAGFKYFLNRNVALNFGAMLIMYESYTKEFTGFREEYGRTAMSLGAGIDFKF